MEEVREWMHEIGEKNRFTISKASGNYWTDMKYKYQVNTTFEKEYDRMNFVLRWTNCPEDEKEDK